MVTDRTIAAIATPPGEGGIAVIRISGKQALDIANKLFSKNLLTFSSHTAHFGQFLDPEGNKIDEGLSLIMKAPRSYTGEDTVEFFCHGGILITKRLLQAAFAAGALPAKPGEFTLKAFLNGKLDLSQAEAVQQMIGAKSAFALSAAAKQLEGMLSTRISSLQEKLVHFTAIIEAWIDFPEEGLEFATREELISSLTEIHSIIHHLCETFEEGRRLHSGYTICLYGAPNVGKSSLLNSILGQDRAIVTEIAGTTRDTLEEEFLLEGMHFRIIDTAGIHETKEQVELEGIKRSKNAAEKADLILFILDSEKGLRKEESEMLSILSPKNTLLIWNKIDIAPNPPSIKNFTSCHISAKTSEGLDNLKKQILKMVGKESLSTEEILITKERHFLALSSTKQCLQNAIQGLKQLHSPEFIASDLRFSLQHLSEIIGRDIPEDLLDAIFSTFCIGK